MMKTKKMAITFLLVAVNAAVLYGIYAFAVNPEPFNPVPQSHEWARDKALEYLDIANPGGWSVTNPNPGLIGATTKIYTSGSLSATVSHSLTPRRRPWSPWSSWTRRPNSGYSKTAQYRT